MFGVSQVLFKVVLNNPDTGHVEAGRVTQGHAVLEGSQ